MINGRLEMRVNCLVKGLRYCYVFEACRVADHSPVVLEVSLVVGKE